MIIEQIAQVAHEANRAYCQTIGDDSQPAWIDTQHWQWSSAINGVKFHLDNPEASASANHQSWFAEKRDQGWKYGPVQDSVKREHPCMVPFGDLPREQQLKDALFKSIVDALRPFAEKP